MLDLGNILPPHFKWVFFKFYNCLSLNCFLIQCAIAILFSLSPYFLEFDKKKRPTFEGRLCFISFFLLESYIIPSILKHNRPCTIPLRASNGNWNPNLCLVYFYSFHTKLTIQIVLSIQDTPTQAHPDWLLCLLCGPLCSSFQEFGA